MYTIYTDKPKGKFIQSKGMGDANLNFKLRSDECFTGKYNRVHWFLRQAFNNPGVTQYTYNEESSSYEYESRALWDPETRIMTTNLYCPFSYGHHIGSTCGCCGQKD